MNSNPNVRSEAHGAALEAYRLAEATLYRFANHENVSNGRGMSWLQTQSQYQALVEARDTARAAVEEANPAGKPTKKDKK